MGYYTFKVACEPWEFEQIHKLNYETFVEEIPQHAPSEQKVLVDKFHNENTYIICVEDDKILGMLAVRGKRPFSLDSKIESLDVYLPPNRSVCEVRLLSAQKDSRHSKVVHGLIAETVKFCLANGYDLAVISGLLQQQKLYRHMGFVPFGPIVGSGAARFQPMFLTPQAYAKSKKPAIRIAEVNVAGKVHLLPGPVEISAEVRAAFAQSKISHRSAEFMEVHKQTRQMLCKLVNARDVQIFMGSGSLANDVIGGQLYLAGGKGLILSNGEFGNRLIDCAKRYGLDFETLGADWGSVFDAGQIENILQSNPDIKWVWAVHSETSTGMLNDIDMLGKICRPRGVKLCLDCISAIGSVKVNLENVYFASGVSGKGLRSFAGLSMVFYNHQLGPSQGKLANYLDLSTYANSDGVPFTICSNLVYALHTAMQGLDIDSRVEQIKELGQWIRSELAGIGLEPLVAGEYACPAVITLVMDRHYNSVEVGDRLTELGYLLSYRSEYLVQRNWIQICLMGDISRQAVKPLLANLRQLLSCQPC